MASLDRFGVRRLAVLGAAVALGSGVASIGLLSAVPPAGAVSASPCTGTTTVTCTFSTIGTQSFQVPSGVNSTTVDSFGAQGAPSTAGAFPKGGSGGEAVATISVTPGESLTVDVGGSGFAAFPNAGFNGGGSTSGTGSPGLGGGGASDVKRGTTVLVIAGGGGGSGQPEGLTGGAGGPGGHADGNGGNGGGVSGCSGGFGGQGGALGGAFGTGGTGTCIDDGFSGGSGTSGQGGTGAGEVDSTGGGGGGGGGGSLGGGGGGGGAFGSVGTGGGGGGGGSSAVPDSTATGISYSDGVRSGDGQVIISYTNPNPDNDLALSQPSNVTTEATGPSGATVDYGLPTVSDPDDATLPTPTCSPASGSTFVVGTTTVNCSVTDTDDTNSPVSTMFNVTVVDTTPPTVTVPANQTVQATSSAGAVVNYPNAFATDLVDGTDPVTCSPAGGSFFSVGTTTVNCDATDNAGNTGSASFTVTVQNPDNDLALSQPPNVTTDATGPSGAKVTYALPTVSDLDNDATLPTPTCSPTSGTVFAVGPTTVHCSVSDPDDTNSPVSISFTVTVKGAAAQLVDLRQVVHGVGSGTSLLSKVAQAQSNLAAGDSKDACGVLGAFINQVKAQAGQIGKTTAATLVADAQQIRAVLGC